jgi:hypothetical protein
LNFFLYAARGPVRTFRHAAAAAQEPANHAQGANHQQEEDVQVVTHHPSPFLHSVMFSRQQCCGSGVFIPDPNFIHPGLRISDPGSPIQKRQQKRGVKSKFLFYLFCSHKYHKIEKN